MYGLTAMFMHLLAQLWMPVIHEIAECVPFNPVIQSR